MTFSIKTFSMMDLSMTLSIKDAQHDDTRLSKECHNSEYPYAECSYAECRYAKCHYAECCYAECRNAECHYAECTLC